MGAGGRGFKSRRPDHLSPPTLQRTCNGAPARVPLPRVRPRESEPPYRGVKTAQSLHYERQSRRLGIRQSQKSESLLGMRLRKLTRARGIAHSGNSGRERFDNESGLHPAEGEEPPRGARTDRPATCWWRMPTDIRRQLTPCPLLVPARTGQDQRRRLSGQMLTRKLTRRQPVADRTPHLLLRECPVAQRGH